jgi:hypothetical protein
MMCELWTGYLCGFLHHAWWILAAVAIFIAVKSMFPKYPAIRLAVLGILTGMAVTVFIELFNHAGQAMSLDQLIAVIVTYSAALYTAICELLQLRYGQILTRWRGEKWAKELDYPYLFFGAIGLVITMNRLDIASTHISRIEIIGPLIVATAVVIRLVKTRVEIAGWNKGDFYED